MDAVGAVGAITSLKHNTWIKLAPKAVTKKKKTGAKYFVKVSDAYFVRFVPTFFFYLEVD